MNDRTTVFVEGTVYWAKIFGDPVLNYEKDGREWTYELVPDNVDFLKKAGLLDRLKSKPDAKNPDKGDYLMLKKPEFDSKGKPNTPIRVYDDEDAAWDGRLLGNGTRVVAKLSIVDWGKGKKQSIYTTALRVEELVPYASNEFGSYDGANAPKTATKAKTAKPETKAAAGDFAELDDEPF